MITVPNFANFDVRLVDTLSADGIAGLGRNSQRDAAAANRRRLVTIFSHEWRDRRNQITAFLRASDGDHDRRVGARHCDVRPVEYRAAKDFINRHHIQPVSRLDFAHGIFLGSELLGVVSFGAHHRDSRQIVLNRLCFLPGCQVIGGASKLVLNSLAMTGIRRMTTWSDNRWTAGRLYEKIGFVFAEEIRPDYFYTNLSEIRSKQSMKKSNTGCPPEITEETWCADHGWRRVYDAGKKRFEWRA